MPPIEDFKNLFSDLNKGDPNNDDTFDFNMDEVLNALHDNNIINDKFSEDEILKAISQLKLYKAARVDRIINEYIKVTATLLLHVYVKLFNTIFENGVLPVLLYQFFKTKVVNSTLKITDRLPYYAAFLSYLPHYVITV